MPLHAASTELRTPLHRDLCIKSIRISGSPTTVASLDTNVILLNHSDPRASAQAPALRRGMGTPLLGVPYMLRTQDTKVNKADKAPALRERSGQWEPPRVQGSAMAGATKRQGGGARPRQRSER